MTRRLEELAQLALDVQDACNLSAVAFVFPAILDDLWRHAKNAGQGTQWVNTNAVTRAFVGKLVSLSGYSMGDGTYQQVSELAAGVQS